LNGAENSSDFLRELKANNEIYEKAVKYFDDSVDLKAAIIGKKVSEVEKEVKKIDEARKINTDDVIKPSAELAENASYKKLQSDVDAEIKDLEFSKN
jgi:hypothetical protein